MLIQFDDDGRKFVVAYANWPDNKIETNYNSYEGECLIIVSLTLCEVLNPTRGLVTPKHGEKICKNY
jgi:hypothetical protein